MNPFDIAEMLKLYRKPRGEPRLGFYRIARILNGKGFLTRTGKLWLGSTVAGIIKRK